jgi:hypothetical protein
VLFVAARRRGLLRRYRVSLLVGAIIVAVVGVLAAQSMLRLQEAAAFRLMFATLTAAIPAAVWWRLRRDVPGYKLPGGVIWISFGLAYASAVTTVVATAVERPGGPTAVFVLEIAAIALLILLGCVLFAAARGRRPVATLRVVAAFGSFGAALIGANVLIRLNVGYLVYAVFGAAWTPLLVVLADFATAGRFRASGRTVAVLVGLLLFVPIGWLAVSPRALLSPFYDTTLADVSIYAATYATVSVGISLAIVLVGFLVRRGKSGDAAAQPLVRAATIALAITKW